MTLLVHLMPKVSTILLNTDLFMLKVQKMKEKLGSKHKNIYLIFLVLNEKKKKKPAADQKCPLLCFLTCVQISSYVL